MARTLLFLSSAAPQRKDSWTPPVDVFRTRDGWLLRYELAGIRIDDVQLQVGQRSISLSGVRKDYMLEEGCSFYSMEISYNRFERVVELPSDLNGARVALDYRDGILLVRISLSSEQALRPAESRKE